MGWFRDSFRGIAIGAGIAVLVPTLVRGGRPMAKTLVKAGLITSARMRESLAETQEQWSDMVAEARAELDQSDSMPAGEGV